MVKGIRFIPFNCIKACVGKVICGDAIKDIEGPGHPCSANSRNHSFSPVATRSIQCPIFLAARLIEGSKVRVPLTRPPHQHNLEHPFQHQGSCRYLMFCPTATPTVNKFAKEIVPRTMRVRRPDLQTYPSTPPKATRPLSWAFTTFAIFKFLRGSQVTEQSAGRGDTLSCNGSMQLRFGMSII